MTDTFTISQSPDSANLYLYPNADISAGLTKSEGANNYGCVNETWSSASDGDYVYTTNIGAKYDYYGLPNHTTETGTINYVKVIGRAKSNTNIQSSSGTYKLGISNGTQKSWGYNEAPLPLSYDNFYYIFTSTPSSAAWTWSSIDTLQIAILCSSPSTTTSSNDFYMYPTANGTHIAFTPVGAATNWQAVSDSNDATYNKIVNPAGTSGYDLYTSTNHSTETTAINDVTFYAQVARHNMSDSGTSKNVVRVGSTATYYFPAQTLEYGLHTVSNVSTTCPSTGVAWTWTNIDNIELGEYFSINGQANVYQVWAKVNYVAYTGNPQIRTSQCYAVVNYTPSTTTVTLNMPESLSVSHSRNIERFLFPAGDYEVIDTGRIAKTLQISGYETSTASVQMQTLKTFTHYGTYVTVAGLSDTNLNTNYYITDFSFENVFNSPVPKYRWSLTLEEA